MNRYGAPIYVRAHDLAVDVHKMRASAVAPDLLAVLRSEARAVLCEISQALTFVPGRTERLDAADRALLRLKVLVRAAQDVGVIELAARERLSDQIVTIGRMLGGWRRHARAAGPTPGGDAPSTARGG